MHIRAQPDLSSCGNGSRSATTQLPRSTPTSHACATMRFWLDAEAYRFLVFYTTVCGSKSLCKLFQQFLSEISLLIGPVVVGHWSLAMVSPLLDTATIIRSPKKYRLIALNKQIIGSLQKLIFAKDNLVSPIRTYRPLSETLASSRWS